eukprot:CAMPEP_0201946232 /NCGR_PEP_ID=MMETSP0903-20130614/54315_1 /ASSEMBLY_ACC=CAM_ASM_000552 /TAXON_ID=420261 /ORGANISM="Thalassiosira antarctica, Strain CCMP982" /LENGTH=287 /DNA_ID=CAMNT_0048489327 /DNA_START=182 /DNA_END=1045 /DNA_ORIENTATION=-
MTGNNISRRRALLLTTIALPSFWASHARPSFAAKLRPDDAYASLVKARQELQVASDRYLPKKDWEGLRTYLTDEAVNMNNYDVSAQALLESKRLDAESKKDIGTIRRYGVGADVIIMYGGLKNEVDEGNESVSYAEVGLLTTIALPSFWASHAGASFAAKLRPDDAYASLVKARQELQIANDTFLQKKDWEGLRTYLTDEAVNMNNYDVSAQALLESKRLDAESKKDIGTIRRYGVGADVIIMYGGLKNEVDEGNESVSYAEVGKFLRGASQSLEEVLAICRSNGFN